jgi:hypothetical protein
VNKVAYYVGDSSQAQNDNGGMKDSGFESLSHPENLKNLYSYSQPENLSTIIK